MAAFRTELACAAMVAALLAGCAGSPVYLPEPEPEPEPETAAAEPPVIVVVDNVRASDLEILRVFSARLGRPYRILDLSHRTPGSVSALLARSAPVQVIALGSSALSAASGIRGVQVLHAAAFDAVEGSPGIDALPPFDVQLDVWTGLNPGLGRLGVIGGLRMAPRMADLARACRDRGLLLEQRTVASDQEMLLAFRALVPKIDGFVFLPDESVLSPGTIRQIIAHARRNNVQTLVYSPVMFNLGATLYVQPDPVSVARSLIARLEDEDAATTVREIRVRSRLEGARTLSAVSPEVLGIADEAAGY